MFAEKLNFLMDITNTKNKTLANAVSLDASYISRLRSGKRKISDKQNLVSLISSFFVERIKSDYHKKALCTTVGIMEYPDTEKKAYALILNWLYTSKHSVDNSMANMLNMFMLPSKPFMQTETVKNSVDSEKLYYYGIEGKQEAVMRFLTNVNKTKTPQTLLLFSDEDMSWIFGNPEYSKKWASLLIETLTRGNKIKIIHSTGRDLNELFEAIAKWVPIYASGMIEPYYYPKIKDGIFQHTFFIAPETNEAVVSSSVKQETEGMLNFYVKDKTAIKALIKEYENYFSLCKPLIQIGNMHSVEKVKKIFKEFNKQITKTIVLRPFLPIATMSKKLADNISKKHKCESLLAIQKTGFEFIKKNKDTTEIITNADLTTDEISFPYSSCIGVKKITYSEKDYEEHLQNTQNLAKKYNYKFIMQDNNFLNNVVLYYKEEYGVMMLKLDFPCTTFLIQEPSMVSAFGEYLNGQLERLTESKKNKKRYEN